MFTLLATIPAPAVPRSDPMDTIAPWLILGLLGLAWLSPFIAAIAGARALTDIPRARRRYVGQAIAWLIAYAAVITSGLVITTRASEDLAPGVGVCCLTVVGPIVAFGLLIQPAFIRGGIGVTLPDPDHDAAARSNSA